MHMPVEMSVEWKELIAIGCHQLVGVLHFFVLFFSQQFVLQNALTKCVDRCLAAVLAVLVH